MPLECDKCLSLQSYSSEFTRAAEEKKEKKKQMLYKKKGSQSAGGINRPFDSNFPCQDQNESQHWPSENPTCQWSELQRPLVCVRLHVPASPGYHQHRMLLRPEEFCATLLLLNQAINNAKSSRITGSGWKHWWDTNKHTHTRSTDTHILFPHRCQLHHLSAAPSTGVREHKMHFQRRKKRYTSLSTLQASEQ